MSSSNNVIQLPTEQEVEVAEISSRTLAKYADSDRVRLSITSDNQETDELVLPGAVVQMLLEILSEMSQGNAISMMPIHAELSTQDAANLLNVSRPYLVKLLKEGDIPFRKVGTHRRVLAEDVINYKRDIDTKRKATLDELAALSQQENMGYE